MTTLLSPDRKDSAMLALDRPGGPASAGTRLTLDQYLALPPDSRVEIVDGVVRPLVRSDQLRRMVQALLWQTLNAAAPPELLVVIEEPVVLADPPPTVRIPDVAVVHPPPRSAMPSNHTRAPGAVLLAEVVSAGTRTADHRDKPAEYARAGVPAFWRVDVEHDGATDRTTEVTVAVHRLADGSYVEQDRFRRGDTVSDPALPWASVEVDTLLGRFA